MTRSPLFVLDNTLRYLYLACRDAGAQFVAIEFIHRGKKWRADTPEEAIALRQKLEEVGEPEQALKAENVWTPDVFWAFVQSIGEQQQHFVRLLLEKHNLYSDETADALNIPESSLAGVLSGLSKQLKSADLIPADLYFANAEWHGKKRRRWFMLQAGFRLAAEELGWPGEKERGRNAATKTRRKH